MRKHETAYLDQQQRALIRQWAGSWLWRSELPTWIIIVIIYGGWLMTLAHWKTLGLLPATALLIWFSSWYMSLQHELIHGHPTRYPRVNQLLGLMPLAIWYPYGLYRDSHLAHHDNHHLTVPPDDPESYYVTDASWRSFPPWRRKLIHMRNTFCGRLLLSPLLDIASTLNHAATAFRQRQSKAIAMWLGHGVLLLATFAWLSKCDFPLFWYVLAVSYPALALTKVRSFLEHRAAEDPLARSVITEAALPWRLLFLNLNYHSVHHDLPGVPWYGLRKVYLYESVRYQQRNGGFIVHGYGQWLRQFFLKPVNVNVHPGFEKGSKNGSDAFAPDVPNEECRNAGAPSGHSTTSGSAQHPRRPGFSGF
ncbi:fatty acid desaturase [Superficieibacter electus]|uniref:Fatty acid desaturase n=1 Tax=Superficieibacter electus TaxID=2022662 RepID=A0A2P5GUC1_9ENTR|nr:fatty acid desaturase [Superficieibacter electus]POP47308.1 fatty acid desaturase [Superficieibacter electus]POP50155.1 fatty acid desaturase [Superficieibacter electus]